VVLPWIKADRKPNISAVLRIRLSFAETGRKALIASSPADASSFMPSRLGYDIVSGEEKKREPRSKGVASFNAAI